MNLVITSFCLFSLIFACFCLSYSQEMNQEETEMEEDSQDEESEESSTEDDDEKDDIFSNFL